MTGKIHSLESFGAVDGPGVRFVVFMQGCALRCKYCHNPDTWCVTGGTEYTPEEVLERMTRNITFYKTGGITVTGGEPLLQIDFVTRLFVLAKAQGIHTCIDTSGITFDMENASKLAKFDALLDVCDLVMLDIKHIDNSEHIKLTGKSNKSVLELAKYLNSKGKKMRIRHVIVPTITDDEVFLARLGKFLSAFDNIEKIELLPYHTMGIPKYDNLGIEYSLRDIPQADSALVNWCYEIINNNMKKE